VIEKKPVANWGFDPFTAFVAGVYVTILVLTLFGYLGWGGD